MRLLKHQTIQRHINNINIYTNLTLDDRRSIKYKQGTEVIT